MGSMAVDGLISGFNTTEMINQLMKLEAAPQTLLKGKVTKAESVVSALQSLNSKLSSLADAAKTAATATSWQAAKATSSAESVTATTSAGAQASALTFSVDRLASRQTTLSGAVTDLASFFDGTVPSSLTLVTGSGADATATAIPLTGVTDLAGLAAAITTAGGATASVVNVGNGQSRLQVSGAGTGAAGGFDLYRGTVTTADGAGTTPPTALLGRTATAATGDGPGGTVITSAADAAVTLWKGVTGAQQTVTSATNTFADVLPGVSFTVLKAEADPVTLTVGRDDAAVKKLASDLATNLSTVLSEITSRTKSTTTRSSDGRSLLTGGVLSGDSAVRSGHQAIVSAASQPVDGTSPSTVGLVLGRDGTVSFDEAKFTAALTADPAKVQAVIAGVAERLQTVAKGLSDSTTGSLSQKIQGQQSYVKTLNAQVDSWDNRLALRRTTLERTYSAMEVSLSNLNAQAGYLSSQLQSLNASK